MKKRVFISFDYDNDKDLSGQLVSQAKLPNAQFSIVNQSLKHSVESNWKEEVRACIHRVDLVIVICGEHTHDTKGVTAELSITNEENKRYFLLRGRHRKTCKKPLGALKSDEIHKWTLKNLAKLIGER